MFLLSFISSTVTTKKLIIQIVQNDTQTMLISEDHKAGLVTKTHCRPFLFQNSRRF